ncbi:MAG: SDR family oxidoreductase, partial [Acidimicrobiia bacterium]|nr:SDR family oxidoreductase [Acidimicrobiia bacterium]
NELDGDVRAVVLDATKREDNVELAGRIADEHGSLDIWVNNAGIYPFSPFTDMSAEEWGRVTTLNLDGVFHGSQAAACHMVDQGSGVIVNMSSTAGYGAEGGNIAHYAATKHAVRGLTKSLAFELGPKGVRAIALAPTLIETPGTVSQKDAISEGMGVDDAHQAFAEQIPLRRIGVPDDVARVVLFAVSGLAEFVSGDTILVDGGLRSR